MRPQTEPRLKGAVWADSGRYAAVFVKRSTKLWTAQELDSAANLRLNSFGRACERAGRHVNISPAPDRLAGLSSRACLTGEQSAFGWVFRVPWAGRASRFRAWR